MLFTMEQQKKITEWPNGKPPVQKFRFSRRGNFAVVRDDGEGKTVKRPRSRSTYLGDNSFPPQNVDDAISW